MSGPVGFDPGPQPELAWLPVDRLAVDRRYQRTIDSRKSQALIERIARDFRWAAFQAILAAPNEGQGWLVLDGQHRAEAARRCGIAHVPAVVVAAASLADQAQAFVRANLDRVSVNAFALYHARLVSGDEDAAAVDRLCRRAGIVIPKYPIPATKLKVGETMALATIGALRRESGEALAELVLRTVVDGTAARPGQIRAPLIRAVAEILAGLPEGRRRLEAGAIEGFLRRTAPAAIAVAAAMARAEGAGEAAALVSVLRDGIETVRDRGDAQHRPHDAAPSRPAPSAIERPTGPASNPAGSSPAGRLPRPAIPVASAQATTASAVAPQPPRRVETNPPVSADAAARKAAGRSSASPGHREVDDAAAISAHIAAKGVTKVGETDSPDVDQVLAEVRRTGDIVVPDDASFGSFTLNGSVILTRRQLLQRANGERVRRGAAPWRETDVRWVRPAPVESSASPHYRRSAQRGAAVTSRLREKA